VPAEQPTALDMGNVLVLTNASATKAGVEKIVPVPSVKRIVMESESALLQTLASVTLVARGANAPSENARTIALDMGRVTRFLEIALAQKDGKEVAVTRPSVTRLTVVVTTDLASLLTSADVIVSIMSPPTEPSLDVAGMVRSAPSLPSVTTNAVAMEPANSEHATVSPDGLLMTALDLTAPQGASMDDVNVPPRNVSACAMKTGLGLPVR